MSYAFSKHKRGRCNLCGKEILWATSNAGTRVAMDTDSMTGWRVDPVTNQVAHCLMHRSHITTCTSANLRNYDKMGGDDAAA